ncbi:MAG: hypothetical protein J7K46_00825 [Bacteroidales bacterium]|nr:hypothetical protein [Bacteroidales bacterium]
MEGGCIDIWREKTVDESQKLVLSRYQDFINGFSSEFNIRFDLIEIVSHYEKMQIISSIGYLPAQEIVVCGWADVIFPVAEMILREFGGYLKLGVGATHEEVSRFKGKWFKIESIKKWDCDEDINIDEPAYEDIWDYRTYHLIDWEFTHNYFNRNVKEKEWKIFSFSNINKS